MAVDKLALVLEWQPWELSDGYSVIFKVPSTLAPVPNAA